MPDEKFYSEEEADRILREAVRIDGSLDRMTRERLEATANEAGISPEALRQAEARVHAQQSGATQATRHEKSQSLELRSKIAGWLSLSATMIGINFLAGGLSNPWCLWVIIPSGLGILGTAIHHALGVKEHEEIGDIKDRPERSFDKPLPNRTFSGNIQVHTQYFPMLDAFFAQNRNARPEEAAQVLRTHTEISIEDSVQTVSAYLERERPQ